MIKYKLICKDCKNLFDSWFSSSKNYEKLKKQNYLNCHKCNSLNVEKTLMSPNVLKTKNSHKVYDEKFKEIKKKILEYQKFVKKNFKYVGKNFAHEARSIHYKDKKKLKGIYGSASRKELEELKEEGIKTELIPWMTDKSN